MPTLLPQDLAARSGPLLFPRSPALERITAVVGAEASPVRGVEEPRGSGGSTERMIEEGGLRLPPCAFPGELDRPIRNVWPDPPSFG